MLLVHGSARLDPSGSGCVATIGNFDGVHLGHRAVLEHLAEMGGRLGLPTWVILFEPQPREYFDPAGAPPRLTRLREKLARLAELPVDFVLLLRFNRKLAELPAAAFIREILIEKLAVKYLVVGDDFRFGRNREGDFHLLEAFGRRAGFAVAGTPSVLVEGERVSSTLIREALAAGRLERAAALLGRPYSVCGRVTHGEKRGRTLGFPTANVLMRRRNTPVQGCLPLQWRDCAIILGPASPMSDCAPPWQADVPCCSRPICSTSPGTCTDAWSRSSFTANSGRNGASRALPSCAPRSSGTWRRRGTISA